MLSLQLIRQNPDQVRQGLLKRDENPDVLEKILALDQQRRQLVTEGDSLRAQQRRLSQEVGQLLGGKGDPANQGRAEELRAQSKALGERIASLEEQTRNKETGLEELLLNLPNLPDETVPVAGDASGNQVVRTWGEPRSFSFTPLPHWELGERLGIIDFYRGQRMSGSRFYILRGQGARLQRALIQWMLDLHTTKHGYTEIYPPFVVREMALVGSGNLPKFVDNLYRDIEDDLWLVPTAEVPLTNLHREEIIEPGRLPLFYVAYTPCFRREKMSAGKDIRGLKRGHQFDKVELYKFVEPSTSFEELEKLVGDAEEVCRLLGMPYRVVLLCTGDLGFPSAKSYDLEVWAPEVQEWLEVSSCSNCTDFQARRADIRYRPAPGARPQHTHTLNGSGLALPRVVAAILENYQQQDGSVVVPEVLRPYTGFEVIC